MSDDSSDDDDLLALNAGLAGGSRSTKRKEEKKLKTNLSFIEAAVEEDAKMRQEKSLRNQVLKDDSDMLIEEAQDNVAQSEKRELDKRAEKSSDGNERQIRAARLTAIETSRSDLVGARPMKRPKRNDDKEPLTASDFQSVLKNLKKSKIKSYLQTIKLDVLSEVLENKTLVVKKLDFPESLERWLWCCSVDLESNYQEGAYETLKGYYSTKLSGSGETFSLTKMTDQWKDWFRVEEEIERDTHDKLLDIQCYLNLWGVLLDSCLGKLDTAVITDILVQLACVVLDKNFYQRKRTLGSAWYRVVSRLIDLVRIQISDDEWNSWVNKTCSRLLDMKICPPHKKAEDSDDKDCLLPRTLLVQAFLTVSKDFGAKLGVLALQRCVKIKDWDQEIEKLFNETHGWLVDEALQYSRDWEVAACIACTYAVIEAKGDEIKLDGPRLLACLKSASKLIEVCIPVLLEGKDNAAKWWALIEKQVLGLAKIVMRFSSQAHFRRAEIELSYLKTFINDTKVIDPEFMKPVQSSMASWIVPKSNGSTA